MPLSDQQSDEGLARTVVSKALDPASSSLKLQSLQSSLLPVVQLLGARWERLVVVGIPDGSFNLLNGPTSTKSFDARCVGVRMTSL